MTHTTNPRPIRTRGLVVLALASAVALGACGEDGGSSSATPAAESSSSDPSESEYCVTAREWAVHGLDPRDDSDPDVLRAFIPEELDHFDRASAAAPDSLVDEWKASSDGFRTMVVPVLAKYGYDIQRVMDEGTPEEQALDQPPPAIAEAQATIREYEALTCGAGPPQAADVEFAGPPAEAYCEAAGTLDGAFGEAISAEDSPAAMEQLLTSDDLSKLMSAIESGAPDEIKADVVALNAWDREKKIPLTARYNYDIRRLILEGAASERAILQSTDPAIRNHYARVAAYGEQLCMGA